MKNDKIVLVFIGSAVEAAFFKEQLEKNNIPSLVKNDFDSGVIAGWGAAGYDNAARLFVPEIYLEKAKNIIYSDSE